MGISSKIIINEDIMKYINPTFKGTGKQIVYKKEADLVLYL